MSRRYIVIAVLVLAFIGLLAILKNLALFIVILVGMVFAFRRYIPSDIMRKLAYVIKGKDRK